MCGATATVEHRVQAGNPCLASLTESYDFWSFPLSPCAVVWAAAFYGHSIRSRCAGNHPLYLE